ncbi:MAG TPA: NAD-dependent epimerase/dehydratase family protein [Lacipirellula sp.]
MSATRIIFGCGYLGLRVGHLWLAASDRTLALTRHEDRAIELAAAGMLTARGDVTEPASLVHVQKAFGIDATPPEAMLYAIGFDRSSATDIRAVYADGLKNVLDAAPRSISRAIYISTTGVYGAAGGGWVDERTPPAPYRDGGKASLAAEQVLSEHPLGRRSAILRLAGIYGPARIPYLDELRNGDPLPVPIAGWLNLIHVDDAARIVVAVDAWLKSQFESNGPHVFCVSDGVPTPRSEYYAEVARLIGAPKPSFSTPPPDSPAAARAAANRRVSNAKLMQTLQVPLAYPDYRKGLAAILAPPTNS